MAEMHQIIFECYFRKINHHNHSLFSVMDFQMLKTLIISTTATLTKVLVSRACISVLVVKAMSTNQNKSDYEKERYPELLLEPSQSKLSSIFEIFAAGSDISNRCLITSNNLFENLRMNLNKYAKFNPSFAQIITFLGSKNKFFSAPINRLKFEILFRTILFAKI